RALRDRIRSPVGSRAPRAAARRARAGAPRVRRDIPSADAIVRGRELGSGFDEACDAVVVGSGAGGAVVATLLAAAGLRVIVLDEGPYYRPADYQAFKPSESVRRLLRPAGHATPVGGGPTPTPP